MPQSRRGFICRGRSEPLRLGDRVRAVAARGAVWRLRPHASGCAAVKRGFWYAYIVAFVCWLWFALAILHAEVLYHPLSSTRELVTTHHTHVQVEGLVLAVLHEDDGDTHIRISDGTVTKCDVPAYMKGSCIVAEIRPGANIEPPKKGDRIRVYGISRYDRAHRFWEVHPVTRLVIVEMAK